MAGGYSYVLAEVASDFAFRLPRREPRRLAVILRELADHPHREGDYRTTDELGRVVQNLLIEDWVISFWADHAVNERRVIEVVQV